MASVGRMASRSRLSSSIISTSFRDMQSMRLWIIQPNWLSIASASGVKTFLLVVMFSSVNLMISTL